MFLLNSEIINTEIYSPATFLECLDPVWLANAGCFCPPLQLSQLGGSILLQEAPAAQ